MFVDVLVILLQSQLGKALIVIRFLSFVQAAQSPSQVQPVC